MYTILTDNQITRNRRVHYVFDGEDTLMFSAPTLKDCIEWLQENKAHKFWLDLGVYRVALYLPIKPSDDHAKVLGWLHKPNYPEDGDGANPQAAALIVK